MGIKGISNILPKDEQNTTDYMNRINEANQEKINYYVPYSANYLKYSDKLKEENEGLKDAKINLFTKEGDGQITLEYDVLDGEKVIHQRLVLATGELRKGADNQSKAVKMMQDMLSKMKDFSSLGNEFNKYATIMQRLGWSVTNECIDIAQMSKQDNETEIKRTKFTQDERINMKPEDMEQGSHRLRLELQTIANIKSFIIEGYKNLYIDPEAVEVKTRKEEVVQYAKGTIKPEKMLAIAFRELKPIAQTQSNYVMERAFAKTVNKYFDDIPDKGNIEKKDIAAYYLVREEYAKRQFGNAIKQDQDKDEEKVSAEQILLNFLTRLDKKTETKREQKRQEVREFVSNRIVSGELDAYVTEDLKKEAQIERKERKNQSAEGPEI